MTPRIRTIVVLTAIVLGLAGCAATPPDGGAAPAGTTPNVAESEPTAGGTDSTTSGSGAVDGEKDGSCALLPVSRANELAHPSSPFAMVQFLVTNDGDQVCSYQSEDQSAVVSVIVYHSGFTFAQQTDRGGIETIPGSPTTMYGDDSADVQVGEGVISAMSFGTTPISRDGLVAMARAAAAASR